jgi:putative ABC transport system ATP-binding protein
MSHTADTALVRLQGVGKVFETEEVMTHALASVDLEIHKGEFLSIAGPSGCGKTTLLSILGLLDSPSSGTYTIDGTPVHQLGAAARARIRRERIGFIFQSFNLIGDLSVQENVELPLGYRGISASERKKRAAAAPSTCRASSRAVSSSASRWREPWSVSPRSCSRTSRPAISTPRTGAR